MTKTTVYLVRHGETEWNKLGKHQGTSDIPLDDTGRKQAHDLTKSFSKFSVQTIYSSPLKRAHQTAIILANGNPVHVIPELRERNYGDFEGRTNKEIRQMHPNLDEEQAKVGLKWAPPNGESCYEVCQRAGKAFQQLFEKHKEQNFAIVSHGSALKGIINWIQGTTDSAEHYFSVTPVRNCELVKFEHDGKSFNITRNYQ